MKIFMPDSQDREKCDDKNGNVHKNRSYVPYDTNSVQY